MTLSVVGTPVSVMYYNKKPKLFGKYHCRDAHAQVKKMNNDGRFVAIVVQSYNKSTDNSPQFCLVYSRRKLDHERK